MVNKKFKFKILLFFTLFLSFSINALSEEKLFFVGKGKDGAYGLYAHKVNSTELLKPLEKSNEPINFTVFKKKLYFAGKDLSQGAVLFVTDGTKAGTHIVKNKDGLKPEYPYELTIAGDKLFFNAADNSNTDTELWVTDGTQKGTEKRDIYKNDESDPQKLTEFNNKLYFTAKDNRGRELWVSGGIEDETKIVQDIHPSGKSSPMHLTVVGDKLFFTASDDSHGRELWVMSKEGSVSFVKDIWKDSSSSSPQKLTVAGDKLFFTPTDNEHSLEPWVSDGTESGTKIVKDIHDGGNPSYPNNLTVVGDKLFFTATDNGSDNTLWMVDVLSNKVTKINKDSINEDLKNPTNLTAFKNKLFFTITRGSKAIIYTYDSTKSEPLNKSLDHSLVTKAGNFKVFDDKLFLMLNQNFLYAYSDKDIRKPIRDFAKKCSIKDLQVFNGKVLFISEDNKLWSTPRDLSEQAGVMLQEYAPEDIIVADVEPYPANNPPTSANTKFIISKENGKTFSARDFKFLDSDEGDSLDQIRLINPEGVSGDLKVKIESGYSERLSGDQDMDVADLNNLKFFPAEDASAGQESSFSFKVSDGKGFSEQSYTCTLKINTPASITSALNTSAAADSKFTYDISTSDDDGQEVNIKVKGDLPAWLHKKNMHWNDESLENIKVNKATCIHEDINGNIYIADKNTIKKIAKNGTISSWQKRGDVDSITSNEKGIVFAIFKNIPARSKADGLYSFVGDQPMKQIIKDGEESIDQHFRGLFYDHKSGLLYTNYKNKVIKINPEDKSFTVVAGSDNEDAQTPEKNSIATEVKFNSPFKLSKDAKGNLYVLHSIGDPESAKSQIVKIDETKNQVSNLYTFDNFVVNSFCLDEESNLYLTFSGENAVYINKLNAEFNSVANFYDGGVASISYSSIAYTKSEEILFAQVSSNGVIYKSSKDVNGFAGTPSGSDIGEHKLTLVVSDGIDEVEKELTITVKSNDTPVEPQPVPPSPSPSPSAPEPNTGGPEIDSNDKNYESSSKKYQKDIKGTGSISGKIKIEKGSGKVKFKSPPLKGLTLNSDGSYKFDSSSYKDLKKGEKKTVKTPVTITDENGKTLKIIMEFEVTGENDAPEIKKINNVIKYKNFEETRIPVKVEDPDNDSGDLRYELEVDDPSLAEVSLDENNQIIVKAEPGASGTANIKLKISDGEKTSVMSFKVKVLSLEDGDNVDEAGDVEVEVEGDVTKTKVKVPEDKIEIETKEDESTGNVEYDLNQDNKKSHAKSELNGSIVEINNKGAKIVYEDENKKLKLNVSSTITGETTGKIEKNGNTTEFISKIPGGDTKIGEKDSRVEIETDLKVWETKEIKAVVGEDGSFKEEITVNGKTTRLSTKIPGSKTVLDENESLKTNLEVNKGSEGNIRKINAVAITDPKGESQTWFEENGKVLERTISEKTPLETGTEIEIIQTGLEIEFKIKTDLTRELIIE